MSHKQKIVWATFYWRALYMRLSLRPVIQYNGIHKEIHQVGERFILKIHQNTTNYFYSVDVSVSIRDHRQKKLLLLMTFSDGHRNVNRVRLISCVMMNF